MINVAYAAAAWWRENPLATEDDAAFALGRLTAKDLEFVGGQAEGDAGPPDETPSEDSSESTGPSSEENQATVEQPTSGDQDSQQSGTSGPPSQSES